MFLQEVHFRNFRCFDDLRLSFAQGEKGTRKWTILLGQNGCGKSNLLKGIALVTAGSDALMTLLGNPDDWILYNRDYCEIGALLVTKSGSERQVSLHINRGDGLSDVLINNRESLSLLDDALEHAERNYFVIGYGAYRRLRSDTSVRSEKGDTPSSVSPFLCLSPQYRRRQSLRWQGRVGHRERRSFPRPVRAGRGRRFEKKD